MERVSGDNSEGRFGGTPLVAIVADDLTGASDSGVGFATRGYETVVVFSGESVPEGEWDVVVFDTDSRSLPEEEAAVRRVESVAGSRVVAGAGVVYKKIDSTLRGNVASEVRAMMAATGREKIIVAPAFPQTGRTTSGGVQFVHEIPVHETEAARDPGTPVTESDLVKLFSGVGEVRRVGVDLLPDREAVRRMLEGCDGIVADATHESHLSLLVGAFGRVEDYLWVGSSGLASALCERLGGESRVAVGGVSGTMGVVGPVLVVVGSLSRASRRQLEFLRSEAGVGAVPLGGLSETVAAARGHLEAGREAVIFSPDKAGSLSASEVSGRLAAVVGELDEAGAFGGLVLTGGDTAVAVGRRLGGRGLRIVGEVEPGVPYGRLIGAREYPVVTKAGGFGEPQTLARAIEFLKASEDITGNHERRA